MSLELIPQWIDWVYAIGWTLLHFLWQGALVGAAYAALRVLLAKARPHARYTVGLGALAILAASPVLTLWQLVPAASGAAAIDGATATHVAAVQALDGELAGAAVAVAQASSPIEPWLPWLVGAWLVGVALFSLRTLYQYLRLRRLCRQGAEPLPDWDERLRLLVRRFGVTRPVQLVKSTIVQTPSLIGWIRPVIVLPTSVLLGLTPQQIELVIAHELGHIRRWDYAVNLLQIGVETVLFYHPVVHWISREVREEREACCDDLVLHRGANPVDYAATLASLEELRGYTHAPALAASGGFLLGRIRRIVGAEPMFAAPLSGGQGMLVAVLAMAAVLSVRPVTHEALSAVESLPETPAQSIARVAVAAVENLVQPSAASAAPAPSETTALQAAPIASATPSLPKLALARPRLAAEPAASMSDLRFELARAPAPTRVEPALPVLDPATATASDDASGIALVSVQPSYPRRAAIAGIEGQVTLGFRIDAVGRARDIRVISRSGDSTFEREAMVALRRWVFAADKVEPGRRFVQAFDFSLGGGVAKPQLAGGLSDEECRQALGSRICKRD